MTSPCYRARTSRDSFRYAHPSFPHRSCRGARPDYVDSPLESQECDYVKLRYTQWAAFCGPFRGDRSGSFAENVAEHSCRDRAPDDELDFFAQRCSRDSSKWAELRSGQAVSYSPLNRGTRRGCMACARCRSETFAVRVRNLGASSDLRPQSPHNTQPLAGADCRIRPCTYSHRDGHGFDSRTVGCLPCRVYEPDAALVSV